MKKYLLDYNVDYFYHSNKIDKYRLNHPQDDNIWIGIEYGEYDPRMPYWINISYMFYEHFDKDRYIYPRFKNFQSLDDAKYFLEKILKDNGFKILKNGLDIYV